MFMILKPRTFEIRKIIKKHKCKYCKKRFQLRNSLDHHVESHVNLDKKSYQKRVNLPI